MLIACSTQAFPSHQSDLETTMLLLLAIILAEAVSGLDALSISNYNKYHTHAELLPYYVFSSSSLLRCAGTCATVEQQICRGYSFAEGVCELYASDIEQRPLYVESEPSEINNEALVIWSTSSSYRGCWIDGSDRDLPVRQSFHNDVVTKEDCMARCHADGYGYAGLQDGRECRCGDSFGMYGQAPESECGKKCSGDTATLCGGRLRNSVYRV